MKLRFYKNKPKSFTEIIINGSKIKPVIQRQQHIGNDDITNQVTDYHLKISECFPCQHAPGTLTKVTPEREVPIMPKATSIQLELRLPIKNDSLLEFREVYQATPSSSKKYPITNENNRVADMILL